MVYPSKLSRERVVGAALSLIQEQGADSLGMRAVALRLSVRPASLYKHVIDLAGLQALLAEHAAGQLLAAIDVAIARAPRAAGLESQKMPMLFMANEYLRFAREQPALYAMLTTPGGLLTSGPSPSEATAAVPQATAPAIPQTARDALSKRLMQVVGELTGPADDAEAAVALWAFLHGFITLERAGMFGPNSPKGGFTRGVRAMAAGLRRPASGGHPAIVEPVP
ncbi:TetR/AcrR family transcriptional regulator [Gemmatimonas groenlandica]|uniref:TetR family transcriptional regulator n=1 Tax=Gemmatimonas groenlandica TaxID=2732249 RepID=A0A6M4INY2_9BACT|nr:TetR/AcrR family transcriptional regulator [Gemmatimonas groenlandica]QJR35735.1 TetR family transcriptional regulator [Gemmatimonas groenlandica]